MPVVLPVVDMQCQSALLCTSLVGLRQSCIFTFDNILAAPGRTTGAYMEENHGVMESS